MPGHIKEEFDGWSLPRECATVRDDRQVPQRPVVDSARVAAARRLAPAPLRSGGDARADPALWRLTALTTFRDLGVLPEIADALETEGIVEPFPIQALAVPIGLNGHDIIGQARTGTGKTLAFGIPLLQRIEHGGRMPRALVIVPTRELAIQVTDDLTVAGRKLGSRVLSVYGGRAYEPQIQALKHGVEVVVGTPGRLLDLMKQKHLDLSQVSVLVLDEADRMLDLGFLPDIERLVDKVPSRRQTMLFSATMPGEIVALSRRYLTRPTNVRAESVDDPETTPQVAQHVFQAHQMDKPELLARVLQARGRGLTMVFCQTKRACDRVADDLTKRGFAAAAVHGDLGQGQRERALRAFRSGKIDVLVATDVAARGLDVDDVTHVINYECPDAADTYVHRIGRTARAGKEGIAVTLVDWSDLQRWKLINTALDLGIAEPAETYSTSDHLYEALDIPAGITGVLPKARRERAGLEAEEVEDIGETGRVRSHQRDAHPDEERRAPKRRSRDRRRTRGGQPLHAPETAEVTGAAVIAGTATDTAAGTTAGTGAGEAGGPAAARTVTAERPARRRTRRRAATAETADVAAQVRAAEQPEPAERPEPVKQADRAEQAEPIETARPVRGAAEGPVPGAVAVVDGAAQTPAAGPNAPAAEPRTAPEPPPVVPASTSAGVPVVQFVPPPIDPAAGEPELPEPARSQPRNRRRTRGKGARESA